MGNILARLTAAFNKAIARLLDGPPPPPLADPIEFKMTIALVATGEFDPHNDSLTPTGARQVSQATTTIKQCFPGRKFVVLDSTWHAEPTRRLDTTGILRRAFSEWRLTEYGGIPKSHELELLEQEIQAGAVFVTTTTRSDMETALWEFGKQSSQQLPFGSFMVIELRVQKTEITPGRFSYSFTTGEVTHRSV